MRGRLGCWRMMAVAGLAGLLPTFLSLFPFAGKPAPRRGPRRPPVCLEAWVRLRSYRGCPVLAAAAGYRLAIHCFRGGHSDGALIFAGPFPGRAYISERPVPLEKWVHLAGLAGSLSTAAGRWIVPETPTRAPIPAAIAFDGRDVTAGRWLAQVNPLPLGYDPEEERPAAVVPPDGEIGAWRLSRGWRSLAQVAAARGSPRCLAPLPQPGAHDLLAGVRPGGGFTARGWKILAAGLLLALTMAAAGMALRPRHRGAPAAAAEGGALERVREER
jgi:hypothetical protein